MKTKSLIAAAALVIASSFATAASAIPVTMTSANLYSGSFQGAAAVNSFTLDLTGIPAGLASFNSFLTANSNGKGYDILGATFDGMAFTPLVNVSAPGVFSVDLWQFSLAGVNAGLHSMVVSGNAVGGATEGFTGSFSISNLPFPAVTAVTAVPEPETYTMLLAGLGLMGAIARRRNKADAA